MAERGAAGPPDFRNREAAEAWLRTQPREVSVAIAARAALRAVPLVEWNQPGEFVNRRPAFLQNLRYVAVSWLSVGLWRPAHESYGRSLVSVDAIKAHDSANQSDGYASSLGYAAYITSTSYHIASLADAQTAAAPASDTRDWLRLVTIHIGHGPAEVAIFGAYNADTAIASSESAVALACSRLWLEGEPELTRSAWAALKSHLLAADEDWEVWIDWYEARLRGDPFDPELELARVLIPDAVWAQGPTAVNAEIARLIAAHRAKARERLMERIAALEATVAALKQESAVRRPEAVPGLGHNNPPETIDDVAEDLQANLDALKAQPPASENHAPALAAVDGLRNGLSRLTGYVGEKLDLFVTEAAREGGKQTGAWAARLAALGFVWAMGLSTEIARVIEAATLWLRSLGAPI